MTMKSTIIGRRSECAALQRAFEATSAGKGGILLIAGEAGAGKTRLAEECLAQSELHTLTGRTTEEATASYAPISMAVRECLQQLEGGASVCGPMSSYLSLLLPELGDPPDDVQPENLVEAIGEALTKKSRQNPAVLFLDDLQWADDATLELLPPLAYRLRNEPLLILGTYRSDEVPRGHRIRRLRNELRRARRLHEISVSTLNRKETEALAERVLGAAPSPSLGRLIFEQTHGLPLFVEELSIALEAGGRALKGNDGIELKPGQDLPIPESVRDAVLIRLDSLSDGARQLIEVASVVGMEFDMDLAAELSGESGGMDELLSRNLIVEKEDGLATFRHALTRESVRGEILWSRRRRLNRKIAEYLESTSSPPELIAEHWLAANESEKARESLLRSAEQSCRLHAYRDAARSANRALEIWPDGRDEEKRLQVLENLAHCAQVSGQLNEAVRALREIIESDISKDEVRRWAEVHRTLATVYGLQGAWDQAMETRGVSATAFEEARLPGEAAVELLVAAAHNTATLRYSLAIGLARRAQELSHEAGRWDVKSRSLGLEGNVLAMQGDYEEGRNAVQSALSLALEHNLIEAAADAYRRLASVSEHSSDYVGARDAYTAAISYCQSQGADVHAQTCMGCMTGVLFQTGEWKRALEVCKDVLADAKSPEGSRTVALGIMGAIRVIRGETRQGRKLLKESLERSARMEIAAMEIMNLWALGLADENEGKVDSAEDHYRTLLERWEEARDRHDAIPGLCACSTFFSKRKLEKETSKCAESLAYIASTTGNPEALAALAFALGESALLHKEAGEAAKQFLQCLKHLEKLEVPFEKAIAEYRAGCALAKEGSNSHAIRLLSTSYQRLRKLGARPLAARVAMELGALGETVDERSPSSVDRQKRAGLTRRQLEVVRLLSEGLTNKEIAEKLYVSTRTVDMHVRDILNRLDCRGRAEAVKRAADLGLLQ